MSLLPQSQAIIFSEGLSEEGPEYRTRQLEIDNLRGAWQGRRFDTCSAVCPLTMTCLFESLKPDKFYVWE